MTSPSAELPRGIGAPATRALTAAGYTSLGQLAAVSDWQLGALHGVDPKALVILREALQERGLSFG